ncbi:MAG: single-stranded-DNA-specific exonuclease RecJ [Acidobacteria bacterium]|nr:single-stranded-DNA-specific exonuclease RecJ [Acidobacteriota bacterium]
MIPTPVRITRGITGARWHLSVCDEHLANRLKSETGEDHILIRCLINRGLRSADEVSDFLAPRFDSHLYSPNLLRDMRTAVERLKSAIINREKIMIVTDFDVDGTTSSVILSQTLKLLGGGNLITCYIPDRFSEGYGLSTSIVERAAADGIKVILTADIGIKSHVEATLARRLGIDLIICDHHLPDGEDVPADAFAVLCPKGSSGVDYPNKHLAACGVSLKLADALLNGHPKHTAILESLAKLTAIGTVADMVDLSEKENRAIVAQGLRALSERSTNPGLRALLKFAQVNGAVTTYDIGFKIGPRINAAGRVAHASSVLALFDAQTDEEANDLAMKLDALNTERQQIQYQLVDKLKVIVESQREKLDSVLLFAGPESEGFHRGVVGIACSKIVEMTGRPTLICSINEQGMAHGSARSINGFHMVDALDTVSDILVKYGGHPMAAGFTLTENKIDEMRYRLNSYAAEVLEPGELGRSLTADAEIGINEVSVDLVRSLARLEPHGIGNPVPTFLIRNVPLKSVQILKEKHLKLILGNGARTVDALWWGASGHKDDLADTAAVALLCRPEINSWNGRETAQLKIIDLSVE